MAFRKTSSRRQTPPQRRGHVPPLPHSSWRLSAPGAEGTLRLASAADFWERLGLD